MLAYSDLTVYKNTDGITTALGCPINSFLLQNNKPLFVGGGKKKKAPSAADEAAHVAYAVVAHNAHNAMGAGAHSGEVEDIDYDNLAVPAGLVCMTQTTCHNVYAPGTGAQAQAEGNEVIPESLYDKLFALAETKPKPLADPKKHTRRNDKKDKKSKSKTHKKRD
jgi:hypothetical protein